MFRYLITVSYDFGGANQWDKSYHLMAHDIVEAATEAQEQCDSDCKGWITKKAHPERGRRCFTY